MGVYGEGNGTPLQYSCLENPMGGGAWWATIHGVAKSRTRLSDFTFTFHFHALEKEVATHSSVLAWRIPGMGEPGGLLSMGSHRVGHDWSDLAAAACEERSSVTFNSLWPHGLYPIRLLSPWKSLGKNTGVCSHSLLQGILLTPGSNPSLLHCRQILYHLNNQGSPLTCQDFAMLICKSAVIITVTLSQEKI